MGETIIIVISMAVSMTACAGVFVGGLIAGYALHDRAQAIEEEQGREGL